MTNFGITYFTNVKFTGMIAIDLEFIPCALPPPVDFYAYFSSMTSFLSRRDFGVIFCCDIIYVSQNI